MSESESWGRVAEDGTVFLRTAEGEREVGNWQAGDAESGLAHYARRYDELLTRARLVRDRLAGKHASVAESKKAAAEIRESLPTAAVIGDLDAVTKLLDEVEGIAAQRRVEEAHLRGVATAKRRALVVEAEALVTSTEWGTASERFRAIVDEWKAAGDGDRNAENALWRRLSAARTAFTHARTEAFAVREAEREAAKGRKEALIKEAESLAESSEWTDTARRYRDLMDSWKAAGRGPKAVEEALWQRFRAAQDKFFARRSEAFAVMDLEQAENQRKKEALLARAEALDPVADLAGSTAALRQIQTEWETIGKVPRASMHDLENRLQDIEDKFRDASDAKWTVATPVNPLVESLRRSVSELEDKLTRAKTRGDMKTASKCEQELGTKRMLLESAEASVATH
ncbi:MAG: hypothetical protein JWM93_459 [Frankiales bacterium]|nr:hypothetical protein [Frankiales bacterium]